MSWLAGRSGCHAGLGVCSCCCLRGHSTNLGLLLLETLARFFDPDGFTIVSAEACSTRSTDVLAINNAKIGVSERIYFSSSLLLDPDATEDMHKTGQNQKERERESGWAIENGPVFFFPPQLQRWRQLGPYILPCADSESFFSVALSTSYKGPIAANRSCFALLHFIGHLR